VPLVTHLPGETAPEEQDLVSVFEARDAGVLPLAELALQNSHIEYLVRRANTPLNVAYRQPTTDFQSSGGVAEILVRAADAVRARDLVVELENPGTAPDLIEDPKDGEWERSSEPNVELVDADANRPIGRLTEEQFQQLDARLEPDAAYEDSYYVGPSTLELLEDGEVDPAVIEMLRTALGSRNGMQVRWTRIN